MSDEVRRTPDGVLLRIGDVVLVREGKDYSRTANPNGSVEVAISGWLEVYWRTGGLRFISNTFGNKYWYLFDEVIKNITFEGELKAKAEENFVNKKRKAILDIFQYSPK